MSCSNLRKGWIIGLKRNGTKEVKITSYKTHYVVDHEGNKIYDSFNVPCGHCLACRLDKARQWAIRCMLESSFYESNYFVTLTYDEANNPHTLIVKDFQLFFMRLRSALKYRGKPDIRFFGCLEYGSTTLRPHAHFIIFNLQLDDLRLLKFSKAGYKLYESKFLNDCWNHGFVQIGDVSFESCGYVARYCMKNNFTASELAKYGLNPERLLMSRRPGIGFGFFNANYKEIYKTDKIYFNFGDMNYCSSPHYFDYLLDKVDKDFAGYIKDKRKAKAQWSEFMKIKDTRFEWFDDYSREVNDINYKKINVLRSRDV